MIRSDATGPALIGACRHRDGLRKLCLARMRSASSALSLMKRLPACITAVNPAADAAAPQRGDAPSSTIAARRPRA